ncbi:phosphoglycolate phosphatase [Chelatococcus sp. SYSU_G07232]|uniref:Phosphoglycolate phosphatase n=1 Tax=Chelatococcus albus TaxID=3047466 RepID=A0ABT7AKE0_9HYPH|nr:phosphoglycolate phosphatase [Chelatococcus sp. SYSU_G07232]MDJ1159827.1 phosphoglycolate phosphatase [Chelatococcus sp. SYSU_G07232]
MTTAPVPIAVFDLDGTLADTAPDLIGTLNIILAREGLPALPLAQARDLIGAGARALIERGLAVNGRTIAPDHLDALYADFLAIYADRIAEETRLFPGVTAALARLTAAGWQLAVCTNKVASHSVQLLAALGIADRFAAICGRDSFPYCKPDPRHLTATIAQAGGDPARAVMIGDSRTDIDTARAAGIPVIAVPFGYTDTAVTALGPDRVIEHFDELWEAASALLPAATPLA